MKWSLTKTKASELLEHIYSNLKKFIIISQSNTSGTYIEKQQQNISRHFYKI